LLRQQETVCTIVATDLKAGEFGIGVAASSLSVGKNVPFTGAHSGAVAVQGYSSPFFGIAGMKLLREQVSAQEVIERLLAGDPLKAHRQIIVLDVTGRTAVHSGAELSPAAGFRQGEGYAVAGCGLPGEEVLAVTATAFEEATGDLAGRLLAALLAGEKKAGADSFESAAVRVSKDQSYPYLDLRVDKHPEAVRELSRIFEIWRKKNANGQTQPTRK
jgi:uncharacterized Ntn-hydrolase superfamily protein